MQLHHKGKNAYSTCCLVVSPPGPIWPQNRRLDAVVEEWGMSCAVPGFALVVVSLSDVLWVPAASLLHFFSRICIINCWWPKSAGNVMCTGYHAGGLVEKKNKAPVHSSHFLFTFSQVNGKSVPFSLLLSGNEGQPACTRGGCVRKVVLVHPWSLAWL